MVGDIAGVCGICIVAVLMCKVTEKYSKEQAVLLVMAVSAMVFLEVTDSMPAILDKAETLAEYSGIDGEYVTILFKALGICWLTQFASDICRDCGENAIASTAEIFGKIQLVLLSLPLFENLTDVVTELLE